MSGNIPEGWAEKPLNDLVDFLDGQRRPIKSADRNHMRGPYPYYGASGIIDWVNDYLFDDDLILLGEDGENILSRNLPLAFAVSGKIWVNNHAHVLRPKAGVDLPFLTQLLDFQDYADLNSGTAQPKLNLQSCKNFKLILPKTLPEQQAIAAALSDADAVVAGLERVIAKKRLIKQGAMQDLLTARRRLPGFSGEWEAKRLAELGDVKTGLTYKPENVKPFGTLVLRSSNIQNDRLAFDNNVFVDVAVSDEATVKAGDLLICVRNGSRQLIGKTAMIDKRADGMAFGAFMSAFRSEVNDYLLWCFQSSVVQDQIAENLGATINQITNKTMKEIEIPLPKDGTERQAISAVLSDMDAEIQTLESRLSKARAVKEGMMQNLLTGRVRLV
jgi:type I restriction enzyme S subunit